MREIAAPAVSDRPDPRSAGKAEVIAVRDLGSNASRFLLARVVEGQGFHVIRRERVQTRLGDGPPGRLRRTAVDATLASVRRFLQNVDGRPARVLAIATAAVREAENRDLLQRGLREREGVALHVLTGREEARLGAEAACEACRSGTRSWPTWAGAVCSSPGFARAGSVGRSASRSARYVSRSGSCHGDRPPPAEMRALRAAVRAQGREVLPPTQAVDRLVGLGGTVRSLARMVLAAGSDDRSRHGMRLRPSDLAAIRSRLERLPFRLRHHVAGLKADRADTILAGVLILEELMSLLGRDADLTVCTAGVRDGLLWSEAFPASRPALRA